MYTYMNILHVDMCIYVCVYVYYYTGTCSRTLKPSPTKTPSSPGLPSPPYIYR